MRRNTRNKLFLACGLMGMLPAFYMAEADPADPANKSGGAGDKEKDKSKEDDKSKEQPKKIELTAEDLQKRIDDALAAQKKQAELAAAEQKRKDEEKAAKEQGEFEKLYNSEIVRTKSLDSENQNLKLELRRTKVVERMRDFVAKDHASYLPVVADYMAPLLKIDSPELSDADADKQIKAIVAKYVADNPRSTTPGLPRIPGRQHTSTTTTNQNSSDDRVAAMQRKSMSYMNS